MKAVVKDSIGEVVDILDYKGLNRKELVFMARQTLARKARLCGATFTINQDDSVSLGNLTYTIEIQ